MKMPDTSKLSAEALGTSEIVGRLKTTRDRILQISNDIDEGMNFETHTKAELRDCVTYWNTCYTDAYQRRVLELTEISVIALSAATGKPPNDEFRRTDPPLKP